MFLMCRCVGVNVFVGLCVCVSGCVSVCMCSNHKLSQLRHLCFNDVTVTITANSGDYVCHNLNSIVYYTYTYTS